MALHENWSVTNGLLYWRGNAGLHDVHPLEAALLEQDAQLVKHEPQIETPLTTY